MSIDENALQRFQTTLDEHTTWPTKYLFKFIVPQAKVAALMVIFEGERWSLRDSEKGNYVGFTVEKEVASAAAVADIYRRASRIEGIIAL